MKQNDVIIGESYRFVTTDVEHRKNMIGTIVTVVGRKQGKLKANYHSGVILTGYYRTPIRYKLSNGQYANASDLRPLKLLSK